jgi:hypothetical protein
MTSRLQNGRLLGKATIIFVNIRVSSAMFVSEVLFIAMSLIPHLPGLHVSAPLSFIFYERV